MRELRSRSSSDSSRHSEECNQPSTTLTANPRFFRFRMRAGRTGGRPADGAISGAIAHLESGVQPLDVLHDGPVQVGDPDFEAVRHRELVGVHEQLVGKRGTDLQELESAQLVSVLHLRKKIAPVTRAPRRRSRRQKTVPRRDPSIVSAGRKRKDVLVALQPIFHAQRDDAPLESLIARQSATAPPTRRRERGGKPRQRLP